MYVITDVTSGGEGSGYYLTNHGLVLAQQKLIVCLLQNVVDQVWMND